MLRFLKKLLFKFFFVTFVNLFEVMFNYYGVSAQKTPKNYLKTLKCVWHPLNLLASFIVYNKICDEIVSYVVLCNFLNILKVPFTFKISAPQKPPKNHHRSLEKDVPSGKFTFTV